MFSPRFSASCIVLQTAEEHDFEPFLASLPIPICIEGMVDLLYSFAPMALCAKE